ncbi:MAG: SRPBCC domain-containing protein, partial [Thermoleophilaceae bacterium]
MGADPQRRVPRLLRAPVRPLTRLAAPSLATVTQPLVAQRIERDILMDAPMEVVWAVVTEPEHIAGWFSHTVELELTPGGSAVFHWDGHGSVKGRVERVEPPRYFSFRWSITDETSTLVEFSLSPEGDSTRLTVVESGFRDLALPEDEKQGHFDGHERGWETESLTLKPNLRRETGQAELVSSIDRADLVLLVFPLYIDALPFLVTK